MLQRFSLLVYQAVLVFLVRYRRTALGPLWLIAGPALFIAVVGLLYGRIGNHDSAVFVPHLAIGLVYWALLSGFVNGAPGIFIRGRAQLMQGSMKLNGVAAADMINTMIIFLHQCLIVIVVMIIYRIVPGPSTILAIAGLGLTIANGYWVSTVFGILGARYRDIAEIFPAVMRIAFLATPIIWIPGPGGRSGVMAAYLLFNPFYHFLEVFRAPLLGNPVSMTSWAVVVCFTAIGLVLAEIMRKRYGQFVPLWI